MYPGMKPMQSYGAGQQSFNAPAPQPLVQPPQQMMPLAQAMSPQAVQPVVPVTPAAPPAADQSFLNAYLQSKQKNKDEEDEKRRMGMAQAMLGAGAQAGINSGSGAGASAGILAMALQGYMNGGGKFGGGTPNAQNVVPGSGK